MDEGEDGEEDPAGAPGEAVVKCQPQGDEEGGDVDEEVEDGEAMAIVDGHGIAGRSKYRHVEHRIHTTSGAHCVYLYFSSWRETVQAAKLRETEGSPTDSLFGE